MKCPNPECQHESHIFPCPVGGCGCAPSYWITGCRDPEPMTRASLKEYAKKADELRSTLERWRATPADE